MTVGMKRYAPFSLLLACLLCAGCIWHKSASSPSSKVTKTGSATTTAPRPIVTPDTSLTAKVVLYNDVGRFVILGFPVGQMPKEGQHLFLYRNGLKVAEVAANGSRTDTFVVADIINGNAQVGDDVRDQ